MFCRITSEEKENLIAETLVLTSVPHPHETDSCQAPRGRGIERCETEMTDYHVDILGGLTHIEKESVWYL